MMQQMGHSMRIQLSDVTLVCQTWGNSLNPPVLLLHGLGDTAAVWTDFAARLSDRYFVIAPDLRGHGDSDKPDRDYGFQVIISDLQQLLKALNLATTPIHLVGHSWTGKLVPMWATQAPEQIRSLVLVDPFFIGKIPTWFRITFPLLYQVLPFIKGMGPFESQDAAIAHAQTMKQYRGWSALQRSAFIASIEPKTGKQWGSKFTIAARDGVFEEVMHVDGLTTELITPTLFIQPQAGLNRTDWQLAPYRRYLKNLTIQSVPGNHWAFLTNPEAFAQAVKPFFDQH